MQYLAYIYDGPAGAATYDLIDAHGTVTRDGKPVRNVGSWLAKGTADECRAAVADYHRAVDAQEVL